jgi:hypothetical protein
LRNTNKRNRPILPRFFLIFFGCLVARQSIAILNR